MALNVKLIQDSFDQARPLGTEVTKKFYDILFTNYPAAKGFFEKTNFEAQEKALLGSLAFIVDNITDAEKLSKYLGDMGARHVDYGVEQEHYALVGDSLLKTFAFFFKDAWTEELNNEWAAAYGVITELMLAGAAQKAA